MGVADSIRDRWDRRIREHTLPTPAYAVVGLLDLVAAQARTAREWFPTAYPDLAERGDRRLSQDQAEEQVRQRIADLADRVAPAAARAQVRSSEAARKAAESPSGQATAARGREAAAATRRAVAQARESMRRRDD